VFAHRLVEALKARGFDVKIDRQDLPKLEDWERELLNFIRQCDTVVFIVSPHSLGSPVVEWEVEQVRLNGKRLAPVVIADIAGQPVPHEIGRINYVFFTEPALFEQRCDELARALNTDVAWLKEHTRLGELARRWVERGKAEDGLIRGSDIDEAVKWAARHPPDAPAVTDAQQAFLAASRVAQARQRRLRRRVQAVLGVLVIGSLGYAAWSNQAYLRPRLSRAIDILRPKTLTLADERALQPKQEFSECTGCPAMVVVPAGRFLMGSPGPEEGSAEPGRKDTEGPRHPVTISRPFAVSRFEVTFDEWDACAALGGCGGQPQDQGWGRGSRPAINVNWNDARQYVAWLSRLTGKPYRLLSEAEWEYAARAGSRTAYYWGDSIRDASGPANADCNGCGSQWDDSQTAPVGSFAENAFGLHDMHGNAWEWVEDCWHDSYKDAPEDGSAWTTACTDEGEHVVRSGAWKDDPVDLRAAARYGGPSGARNWVNGIRVARTLAP